MEVIENLQRVEKYILESIKNTNDKYIIRNAKYNLKQIQELIKKKSNA
jgi:hypothetical protein